MQSRLHPIHSRPCEVIVILSIIIHNLWTAGDVDHRSQLVDHRRGGLGGSGLRVAVHVSVAAGFVWQGGFQWRRDS